MTVKQIWTSGSTARKSRYAWTTLGSILGIAALMMVLLFGGMALGMTLHWPMRWVSLLLCAGVTALGVRLGLGAGRRSLRDTTVFLLTGDNRLFFLNAADLNRGRSPLDYAKGTLDTQALLRRLAAAPFVPATAREILQVEHIRENAREYALRCRVRVGDGPVFRQTCLLVKGLENEDLLLRQLERRQDWRADLEPGETTTAFSIALSGSVLALLVLLCVMSHPAVAALPEAIYFPCLGAAFVALFVLVCMVVQRQRGE